MNTFSSYIIDAYWERIHLYLRIKTAENISLSERTAIYLINQELRAETAFKILDFDKNEFLVTLNVTNNGVNRCINNGIYTVLLVDEGNAFSEAEFSGSNKTLEGWGRCFRYLSSKGAYTVTFMLDEYSEKPRFQLLIYNMVRRGMNNLVPFTNSAYPAHQSPRLSGLKKGIQGRIGKYIGKCQKYTYRIVNRLYLHKPYMLFLSEQDDKLALNMSALYNRLKERELDKQYRILFSLRKATSEKQSILSSIRLTLYAAMASIIIVDDHVPLFDWLVLNPETKVIQIWHAGAGFKGVGYSRWGHFGCPGPFSCHRQYTYSISGSAHISGFFSEQFGILDQQIIPTGMPRMDQFLNPENQERTRKNIYEHYPAFQNRKVILFAPTYRGQNRKNAYYPYEKIDFDRLYQYCSAHNTVVLFKMHPWVQGAVPIQKEYQDLFFDMNAYPDINELFLITDLLITDYSSSIYEFSLMRKPMLFFAFDKDQYATSRGFHRKYEENIPGRLCETFSDMMNALEAEDFEFFKVAEYIENHFEHVDDNNCDRVIDWLILDKLPPRFKNELQLQQEWIRGIRGKSFEHLFIR